MALSPSLGRDSFVIDGEVYELLEEAGERRWQTDMVATQPGDALAKPYFLSAHGGFGASQRHLGADGQPTDPTHHDYGQNVNATRESLIAPASRITYLDLSAKASRSKGFRIGGYATSRIGGGSSGSPTGAIGGGGLAFTPQRVVEFGRSLYFLCGSHTIVVDPDLETPAAVEGRNHGTSARARSGDVFNNRLCIALGDNVDAEVVTRPYSPSTGSSAWATATGIKMSVYQRGSAGRLFSAQSGKAFNVLPGNNPATAANYLPSNGEVITDPSDPVRALVEFASALVAGTPKTARTIDPDRGYQSVALVPESRLSASEYDGRAMISNGPVLFHATTQGVNLLSLNTAPLPVGPEELENNDSPYKGGEPGVPDYTGQFIAWPYYFPATGDSVIFLVRRRRQDDPGTGPYIWYDHLYLPGRECRAVYFWGGSTTRGPRLFFGAGTASNPLQAGWIDWDEADAQPATSAFIEWPLDDFGHPGVTLECERVEMADVENADTDNYLKWSVKPLGGSFIDLVKAQSGSNQERVNSTGFQQVFAPNADIPSGKGLKFRVDFTQASAATAFVKLRGTPIAYVAARPERTKQVTALLNVRGKRIEDAEVIAGRLNELVGQKARVQHAPGIEDSYIRIESAKSTEVEVNSGGGNKADRRVAVELVFREVAVA